MRDRALHRPRALDDLRQEHLAGAKQIADDLHAVHQRPLDDLERPLVLLARLLDVGVDEVDDAVDERIGESRFDAALAPRDIGFFLLASALDLLGELHHPLGRVRAPVEDDVLDVLQQILRDVLVDDQLASIDDAHVHPGLDGVKQKRRVDGFADRVVATEREGQIADAAADLHPGTRRLDDARGLDEVDRVVVVLLEAGGNREDVRIEDDVGRVETGLLRQDRVGALADRDLALDRIRLTNLIERHHDDAGAETLDDASPCGGSRLRLP